MGQDAIIVIDDRYYRLDHAWKYFPFDSGDHMIKQKALEYIKEKKGSLLEDLLEEQDDDPNGAKAYYYAAMDHLTLGEIIINSAKEDNIKFYPDNCDEFCNGYPGGEKNDICSNYKHMNEENIWEEII